jgi:hypothetical protein
VKDEVEEHREIDPKENPTVLGLLAGKAGCQSTAPRLEVGKAPAGAPLGTVPTGESSNATFGGADRRTLYVTSRALLKSVMLAVPGLPD